MVRTHVWLLHPGPPPSGGVLGRFWAWLRMRMGRTPPALTGPVELDGLDELSVALRQKLGSRYCCLPVIARPGPLLDEALRELIPKERLVLVVFGRVDSKQRHRILRDARRLSSGKTESLTTLRLAEDTAFVAEALDWRRRLACIARMESSEDEGEGIPELLQSRPYIEGLARAIRQAERDTGWLVPEDWIREAVARAWRAIDGGISVEDATTLAEPSPPVFPWIDELLVDREVE